MADTCLDTLIDLLPCATTDKCLVAVDSVLHSLHQFDRSSRHRPELLQLVLHRVCTTVCCRLTSCRVDGTVIKALQLVHKLVHLLDHFLLLWDDALPEAEWIQLHVSLCYLLTWFDTDGILDTMIVSKAPSITNATITGTETPIATATISEAATISTTCRTVGCFS